MKIISVIALFSSLAFGQQPATQQPPVTVRRQPPAATPDPRQYPFSQILSTLQDGAISTPSISVSPSGGSEVPIRQDSGKAEPVKDIPLSESAAGALGWANRGWSRSMSPLLAKMAA